MPSDFVLKAMNTVHRLILTVTGNRVGWSAMNMPVLELTTIGRRSGRPHSTMLTSPLQLGDTFVIVASRGGDDHHPAWFLNLRDAPVVQVSVQGSELRQMRARIVSPDERARLWPRLVADHPNYAEYQTRTTREIPLILLEPVSASSAPS